MAFIKEETEDIKMEFVKEETGELKIENVFTLKHEETEAQTENMARPCDVGFSSTSRDTGAFKRARHSSCSVFGCTNEHKSLYSVPSSNPLKDQWVNFIFSGNAPTQLPKLLYVCANHFTDDCFLNLGQFRVGLAERLKIISGSVPTLLGYAKNLGQASTSSPYIHLPLSRDVACQTDRLPKRTVGTQLSAKTLGPHFRSEGVQATVSCKDFGVGTVSPTPLKRPRLEPEECEEEDPLESSSSVEASDGQDSTYDPADSITSSLDDSIKSEEPSTPTHHSNKYIMYESCIMELFNVCPVCTGACDVRTQRLGTFLSVNQQCPHCSFSRHWNSQPILGSTPAGNLHLSAAMYLSGVSFRQIEKVFKAMNLQLFQYETYRRHARAFIEPAVIHHWKVTQDVNLQRLNQVEKVTLGGEMRTNCPGHPAKYGSYTMMDLHTNTVVDIQLVQRNEVGGSSHMEKEGLTRSLALLESRGVNLDCIVTDRHPQVQKFLGERNITHYYDVRRMAKGISKKLEVISKQKDCEKLKKWIKSIVDHIYWTAAGSTSGPERIAKWTTILNHVRDVHTHEDPLYPKCEHPIRKTTDESKWLQAATVVFNKLEKLLTSKRTLEDVEKLSPYHQTSSLEAFNAVTLSFAPKNILFPFIGMLCRLYLAAMHYNENADRPQAETEEGAKISFPKARKGECKVKPGKTYDLTSLKEESEVLNEIEEKDQYNNHHDFITGEKTFSCSQTEQTASRKRAKKTRTGSNFTCQQCGSNFSQKVSLNRHMRIHTGEKRHTCQQCGKCFAEKVSLKRHLRVHTGEKPYTCPQCRKSFSCKGNLKVHMRVHTGESPYTCQQCGNRFSLKGSLKKHMRTHTGEKPYTCPQCEISFTLKESLNRHMRTHTGVKPYTCPQCGKTFAEKGSLDRHMRIHTGEKPYTCQQCGKGFTQIGNLKAHMSVHAGETPFTCQHCGRSFNRKGNLNCHMRVHTKESLFICKQCGISFTQKESFDRHITIHTIEKPYTCQQCGKCFDQHEKFKVHMRLHPGEQPYTCPQCGKSFKQERHFKIHMRIHSGEQPYTCPQCGKSFNQKQHFVDHIRIHTGEKPFICQQCGKSFNRKGILTRHMRVHTGEKPFTCGHCGKGFRYKVGLKYHMRIHV